MTEKKYTITGYIDYVLPFSFEIVAKSASQAHKLAQKEALHYDFQRDAERSAIFIDPPVLIHNTSSNL